MSNRHSSRPISPGDYYDLGRLTPDGYAGVAVVTGWQLLTAYTARTGRFLSGLNPPTEAEIGAWLNTDAQGRQLLLGVRT